MGEFQVAANLAFTGETETLSRESCVVSGVEEEASLQCVATSPGGRAEVTGSLSIAEGGMTGGPCLGRAESRPRGVGMCESPPTCYHFISCRHQHNAL